MNKGLLYRTRTYLAGNLEFSSETTNWRTQVKQELEPLGIICFDPMQGNFINDQDESDEYRNKIISQRESGNWEEVQNFMKGVIEKDLRLIDIVDFVIFKFEFDKPTYGTTHELIMAQAEKKPIFVVADDKRKVPLWLVGLLPEKYIYDSIESVISTVKLINSGEKPIDSRRWHLLKEKYR